MANVRHQGVSEVPLHIDPQLRQFLLQVRQQLVSTSGPQKPPAVPSNVTATALPLAILIQWSRGDAGDGHEVLWNTTANAATAHVVDVGNSAQWTDFIGVAGVARFYWVRSYTLAGIRSRESNSVTATSQTTAGAGATPTPPIASQKMVKELATGRLVPERSRKL